MLKKILIVVGIVVFMVCVAFGVSLYMEKHVKYDIDMNLKGKVTKIVVEKEKRILHLYSGDMIIKSYQNIALGRNPIGHKQFEGDSKTPEGSYIIDSKNPKSRYFLNLGISYPNEIDKQNAAKLGKSAGGDIKIHGLPNGASLISGAFDWDWTDGCIAVDNHSMNELFNVVEIGTPIVILP